MPSPSRRRSQRQRRSQPLLPVSSHAASSSTNGSPAAEQRLVYQGRNHRSYDELNHGSLAESVLADDGVFEVELELRNPTYLGSLRYADPDGHVPSVPGTGPAVPRNRRTKADLPRMRQVVVHAIEHIHVAGISDAATEVVGSNSEEILWKDTHRDLLRIVADDHRRSCAPLLTPK